MNIEKEIEKKARELNWFKRKIFILQFISKSRKSVSQECIEFGISKSIYYQWKKRYELEGEDGLKRKKPIAYHHPNKIPQQIIEKVIELRNVYQLGSIRITWYLERYHGIKTTK